MRTVTATRYVTPLREGGSLPAIVEADDAGLYVLKFRGAGQGHKALVAELLAGELARALGLRVPELVRVELDQALGRTEPDPEIQGLIKASAGLNLALDYLPGSITFDPLVPAGLDAETASRIVWFDAYVTNIDRTPKNPNLLIWHRQLWLIDHGAALYFHHAWDGYLEKSRKPFPQIKDHVLLPFASALPEADAALRPKVTEALLRSITAEIPDAWLEGEERFESPDAHREAYVAYLAARLEACAELTEEAVRARTLLL